MTTNILTMRFTGEVQAIAGPDFFWVRQDGFLHKDGEQWPGHMFFFASKEPPIEQGRSINAIGEQYQFSIDKGLHKRPGEDWNFTMITFASPFGDLKIESPKGITDVYNPVP